MEITMHTLAELLPGESMVSAARLGECELLLDPGVACVDLRSTSHSWMVLPSQPFKNGNSVRVRGPGRSDLFYLDQRVLLSVSLDGNWRKSDAHPFGSTAFVEDSRGVRRLWNLMSSPGEPDLDSLNRHHPRPTGYVWVKGTNVFFTIGDPPNPTGRTPQDQPLLILSSQFDDEEGTSK